MPALNILAWKRRRSVLEREKQPGGLPMRCYSLHILAGLFRPRQSSPDGGRVDQRLNLFCIFLRRRIVNHYAEIRPSVDRKGRLFERKRAKNRLAYALDGFAVGVENFILAAYRPELGVELGWRSRDAPC